MKIIIRTFAGICLFSILVVSSGCPASSKEQAPKGNYQEVLYLYDNHYRPDSLLERVVRKDYVVAGNLMVPDGSVEEIYEYVIKDGIPIRTELYRISGTGEKQLRQIISRTPTSEEVFYLDGEGNVTSMDLTVYDEHGRTVKTKSHSDNYDIDLVFQMSGSKIYEYLYSYDTLDRCFRETRTVITSDWVTRTETIRTFRDDTEELLSEKWTNLDSGIGGVTSYTSRHSGDTLIQEGYSQEGEFQYMIKKVPGYTVEYYFDEDGSVHMLDEIITDGDRRTEIFWEPVRNSGDTTVYIADKEIRRVNISPYAHIINEFEYDSRGNLTSERTKATFYEDIYDEEWE